MESSTQKGFGTVVSLLPGRVIVLQTLPGTPSAKAGLAPGDEILAINGYIVARLDLDQLTELLGVARQARPASTSGGPGEARIMRIDPDARGDADRQRGPRLLRGSGHRLYPRFQLR